MPKHATVRYQPLQTCLVNLPLSLYGQLVSRSVTPQSVVVCLSFADKDSHTAGHDGKKSSKAAAKSEGRRTYVGWSGMPSRLVGGLAGIGKGQEALEIDPVCGKELGIAEGTEVTIDFLRNLPAAQTVNVEPVLADDWELVELHAEYLEQNLLSQVRAASPGQIVCVWVGKSKSLVRLKIVTVAPVEDIAVRLTIDTEVVVAPKTRYGAKSNAGLEKHDLATAQASQKPQTQITPEAEAASKRLLRLLPESAAIDVDDGSGDSDTAWVDPHHFSLLLQAFPTTRVALQVKNCPSLGPRQQRAGGTETDASKQADRTADASDVHSLFYLKTNAAIPRDNVWLSKAGRKALSLDSSAIELLQMSAVQRDARGGQAPENSVADSTTATTAAADVATKVPDAPLAGFDKHLFKAVAYMQQALSSGLATMTTSSSVGGLLVCGGAGSGKTALVETLCQKAKAAPGVYAQVQIVKCPQLVNLRIPQLRSRLEEEMTNAAWYSPSVIVFDDLDHLAPAEMEHVDSFRSLHIANLFSAVVKKTQARNGILVIATAKAPESLHGHLAQSHLFSERLTLSAPDKESRKEILASLTRAKSQASQDLVLADDLNFSAVAAQTDGYLPVDLRDLVDRALHQAAIRAGKSGRVTLELSLADINAAQADFTPLSLRDVKLQKSEVEWSDIGGLQETRRVLRETLEWPTKYSAIFASSPLRLRSGLLLYGFPGCGKTLLASAVAKECGLNFISVKGPEILNKYIGASEKSVRDLFDRAQAAKPCVLFFDEFDSIAPKRGHDSTGVTDRVVNQMLTQMDGAEGLEGVYVLAATSRPDLIDPALLRPGRLDKSLLCDMPNAEDRLDILRACARKITLSENIRLEDYVSRTEGYSGADLQAVLYNAHLACIHHNIADTRQGTEKSDQLAENDSKDLEYISLGTKLSGKGAGALIKSQAEKAQMTKRLEQIMQSIGGMSMSNRSAGQNASRNKTFVQARHIDEALQSTRPSLPKDETMRLQRIYNDFVSARAKGGLPDGRPSDEIGGRSSLM